MRLVQGAFEELRTEMRALASHLSAQQLGALAHLSAARSHTFPGGTHGYRSPGIDWAPAVCGSGPGLNRRRVQLPAVPQAAPGADATRPSAMQWASSPPADGGGCEDGGGGGRAAPHGGGSRGRAARERRGAGSAMERMNGGAGPMVEQPRRALDVTQRAAARQANGRSAARVVPPRRRGGHTSEEGAYRPGGPLLGGSVPGAALRRCGHAGGVCAGAMGEQGGCCKAGGVHRSDRGSGAESPFPVQQHRSVPKGLAGASDERAGNRGSPRATSAQEHALEKELERLKGRMKAKAMAGALMTVQRYQPGAAPMRVQSKGAPAARGAGNRKPVSVPAVW